MRNIEAKAKAAGVGDGAEEEEEEDNDAAGDLVMTQIQRCEVDINSTQVRACVSRCGVVYIVVCEVCRRR